MLKEQFNMLNLAKGGGGRILEDNMIYWEL